MSVINDVIRGALKLNLLPDNQCFEDVKALLKAIPELYSVEIPINVGAVVVGISEPSEQDRDKVWFRRDVNGKPIGFYQFCNDKWILAFNFAPGELPFVYGDSRNIPAGFKLADSSVIPAVIANHIKLQWIKDPTNTWYIYYQLVYIGC